MEAMKLQRLLAEFHLRHGVDEAARLQHIDENIVYIQGI
jgi:hypothetical protein